VVRVGFGGADTYDLFIDARTGELLGERITEDQQTQKIGPGYLGSRLSHWSEAAAGTNVTLTLAVGSTRKLTLADYY
jgi:hypothetical protein